MSFGLGSAVSGIPAFVGGLLGIRIFTSGAGWFFATLLMIALAALSATIGSNMLSTQPRLGRWLIEVWIFAAVGVTALATTLIIHVALEQLPSWLIGSAPLDKATLKEVSSTLLGAVSAIVALAWTKDIGDAKGFFWPSTQFKSGMAAAYKRLPRKPAGNGTPDEVRVYNAIFDDHIMGEKGEVGWSLSARGLRAEIVAGYLRL